MSLPLIVMSELLVTEFTRVLFYLEVDGVVVAAIDEGLILPLKYTPTDWAHGLTINRY